MFVIATDSTFDDVMTSRSRSVEVSHSGVISSMVRGNCMALMPPVCPKPSYASGGPAALVSHPIGRLTRTQGPRQIPIAQGYPL